LTQNVFEPHGQDAPKTTRDRVVRSASAAVLLCWLSMSCAALRADIRYQQLRNEIGNSLPTGANTMVAHSEPELVTGTDQFYPLETSPHFTGKSFIYGSGSHEASTHATEVGENFYGNFDSPAPGIDEIRLYTAGGWLGSNYLRHSTTQFPQFSAARVANHSWISDNDDQSTNILQRMDYLVEKDDFIQVAGVNNRPNNVNTPVDVFAGGMNTILVGTTLGGHSTGTNIGLASPYVPGRTRPHLVAPGSVATSFTAPLVAGTAAMLVDTAHTRPALSNGSVQTSVGRANLTIQHGETSEVIRAILLAGADRQELFAGGAETWSINTAEGLNSKYGAGELDVYNSYHILAGGEHNSWDANPKEIRIYGWDYDAAFVSNTTKTYRFTIEEGTREFAASLAWNLDINLVPNAPSGVVADPSPSLRNLNLRLRNMATDATIQQSIGTADVMENLYVPALGPGQYELIVSATGIVQYTTEYGLAWRFATSTPPVAGDVDLDGRVNLADLSILQRNFGQSTRILRTDGDLNGDGIVNRSDLTILADQFGLGAVAIPTEVSELLAAANSAPAPIPEPVTAWAAAIALCGLLAFRAAGRRNHRQG
jgi:hypothetical protein